jgi:hypothetical protein
MPSRQQISGPLLDSMDAAVMKRLKKTLRGEYAVLASDGWKDESRDSVNGVNLSVSGKLSSLCWRTQVLELLTYLYKDLSCRPYLGYITQKRW